MGQDSDFEVQFEKEQEIFYEGDQILGFVKISAKDDIVYKTLKVRIDGKAVSIWKSGCLNNGERKEGPVLPLDENSLALFNTDDYSEESILDISIVVQKADEGQEFDVIFAGEHCLPFECKLPLELPSSFCGQKGWIAYTASVLLEQELDGILTDTVKTSRSFVIVSGLDLSFLPQAAEKIEVCKYRDIGVCCTEGSITCDWSVARSGYVPGETIWIQGTVQNESKRTINNSTVSLQLVVEYKNGRKHKRERCLVASVEKESTPPGEMTLWNDPLVVPVVPPTGLGRSKLVDISYQLEFKATFGNGAHSAVTVTKDLIIGTIKMSPAEMRSFDLALYTLPFFSSRNRLASEDSSSEFSLSDPLIASGGEGGCPDTPPAPIFDSNGMIRNDLLDRLTHGPSIIIPPPPSDYDCSMELPRPPPYAPGHSE